MSLSSMLLFFILLVTFFWVFHFFAFTCLLLSFRILLQKMIVIIENGMEPSKNHDPNRLFISFSPTSKFQDGNDDVKLYNIIHSFIHS